MSLQISVEDAYADTPSFRNQIKNSEISVCNLEVCIKKLIQTTTSMCDLSRSYAEKHTSLLTDLEEYLKLPHACDSESLGSFPILLEALQEIEGHRAYLHRHFRDVFVENLHKFLIEEIQPLKKIGKEFQQATYNHETVLGKYMAKRAGSSVEEGTVEVGEARKILHRKAVEYSVKLNLFQEKRQFEIPEQTVSLVCAQMTFFHQAYDALRDLDPAVKTMSTTYQHFRTDYENISESFEIERHLEGTSAAIYNPMCTPHPRKNIPEVVKGGFLFKKGSGKMRTIWNRRYFELKEDGKLHYYSDTKEDDQTTLDLRICMVREAPTDRKYCFEIVSPNKQHVLQAESETEMNQWITLLKSAISGAIKQMATTVVGTNLVTIAAETNSRELVKQLREIPGNDKCAECNELEALEWCSTNLGILVCLKCSGSHRGLGRHVSKVRSLVLDTMDIETMALVKELGNQKVNSIFEAKVGEFQKPTPESDTLTREKWCTAKYSQQKMISKRESSDQTMDILRAVKTRDVLGTFDCLLRGFDVNEVDLQKKSILHHAVAVGDIAIVELLYQWNANLNAQDEHGRTPLHVAVENNNAEMSSILYSKRLMNIHLKDENDRTPMDVAVEMDHPNVVAVLKRKGYTRDKGNSFTQPPDEALFNAMQAKPKEMRKIQESTVNDFPVFDQTPW
ncbi:Arf-GAP with coiled-coil, ANK repeat and PH domain-containing protein 1 [Nowakowskiella sp. JEL0078]|nr:Arf-GAP with coiled-coil, ANK repeat and PH domain-containing protein 1 [Nowakowskiella sp. JEL0078]